MLLKRFNNYSNGLAVATEWVVDDPEELKEPRYFYDDYEELVLDVESRHRIKIGTPIVFTYDFGNGLKYQSEVTTYGKIRISKILGRNMIISHCSYDSRR
jgi:hypothetical protein